MAVVLAFLSGVVFGVVGVFVAAMWVAADAGYAASPEGLAECVRGKECLSKGIFSGNGEWKTPPALSQWASATFGAFDEVWDNPPYGRAADVGHATSPDGPTKSVRTEAGNDQA